MRAGTFAETNLLWNRQSLLFSGDSSAGLWSEHACSLFICLPCEVNISAKNTNIQKQHRNLITVGEGFAIA